eukprot:3328867-Rhodomonas_salina.2
MGTYGDMETDGDMEIKNTHTHNNNKKKTTSASSSSASSWAVDLGEERLLLGRPHPVGRRHLELFPERSHLRARTTTS